MHRKTTTARHNVNKLCRGKRVHKHILQRCMLLYNLNCFFHNKHRYTGFNLCCHSSTAVIMFWHNICPIHSLHLYTETSQRGKGGSTATNRYLILKHNIFCTIVNLRLHTVYLYRDKSGKKRGLLEYSSNHHVLTQKRFCAVNPTLPPVIGVSRGCCGHASGIPLSRPPWFAVCAPHATPCFLQGIPGARCVDLRYK